MFAASNSWRRPWLELIKPIGWFSRPKTFRSAMRRIKYNLSYFRANYTMVALFIFFLSLVLHREAVFFFTLFMLVLFLFYFIVDYPFEFEVWNQPMADCSWKFFRPSPFWLCSMPVSGSTCWFRSWLALGILDYTPLLGVCFSKT